MSNPDLAAKLVALKQDVERVKQRRSEAQIAQRVAQQQLESIDAEIRAMGVDPDKIDVELNALDETISQQTVLVEEALKTESATYDGILAAARTAGVIR